jgi:hypothetical protein
MEGLNDTVSKGLESLGLEITKTMNGVIEAVTPDYSFKEFKPESEKGNTEDKHVEQLPNKLAIEKDGSKDNAMYSIKHPSGSRYDMLDDGRMVIKSGKSMQIMALKNILMNSSNALEVKASRSMNLKTTDFFLESDAVVIDAKDIIIQGNLHIVGDFAIEGDLEIFGDMNVSGETMFGGIVFSEHTHQSTPSVTSAPIQPITPIESSNNPSSDESIQEESSGVVNNERSEKYSYFMNKREALKAKREARSKTINLRRRRL